MATITVRGEVVANVEELASLLWDGIETAAESGCDDVAMTRHGAVVVSGAPADLTIRQIHEYVTLAVLTWGTRSVNRGSRSEFWNNTAQKWCLKQVRFAYGIREEGE